MAVSSAGLFLKQHNHRHIHQLRSSTEDNFTDVGPPLSLFETNGLEGHKRPLNILFQSACYLLFPILIFTACWAYQIGLQMSVISTFHLHNIIKYHFYNFLLSKKTLFENLKNCCFNLNNKKRLLVFSKCCVFWQKNFQSLYFVISMESWQNWQGWKLKLFESWSLLLER